MKGMHNSLQWLYKRYITESTSIADMAKEAGVAEMTIRRALDKKELLKK